MTIGECVAEADLLRPNAISEGEKIAWCAELEAQLKREFYPRYLDSEEAEAEETPSRETKLSGSGPYERMYVYYVASMIDFASQETETYTMDAAMFREAMDSFRKEYHRTHTHR